MKDNTAHGIIERICVTTVSGAIWHVITLTNPYWAGTLMMFIPPNIIVIVQIHIVWRPKCRNDTLTLITFNVQYKKKKKLLTHLKQIILSSNIAHYCKWPWYGAECRDTMFVYRSSITPDFIL